MARELIDLGARTLVRIGTCGALDGGLELGALVSAEQALAADGTSRALGAGDRVPADPELAAALRGTGATPVTAVTTDLFYDGGAHLEEWLAAGAQVVEMEAAAILSVAAAHGARAAVLLGVTDLLGIPGTAKAVRAQAAEGPDRRPGLRAAGCPPRRGGLGGAG